MYRVSARLACHPVPVASTRSSAHSPSLRQRAALPIADCRHEDEPGCAVLAALALGELNEDEWQHYRKLLAEERRNIAAHEQHRQQRAFGRMVRAVLREKQRQGRS